MNSLFQTRLKGILSQISFFCKYEVKHFKELDSTNTFLKSRIASGKTNPIIVIADHQTSGRGQFDRDWNDFPGKSLLFSFSLDLSVFNSLDILPLSLFTGLVCAVALNSKMRDKSIETWLKWPNDLWLGFNKIGGILVENVILPESQTAIIGIGINLGDFEKDGIKYIAPLVSCDALEVLKTFFYNFQDIMNTDLESQVKRWNFFAAPMFENRFLAILPDGKEKIVRPVKVLNTGELVCLCEQGEAVHFNSLRRLVPIKKAVKL